MFRPRSCPACKSSDVHRFPRQFMREYFFLIRPFRCFACNQRFTRLQAYALGLNGFLQARPGHMVSKPLRKLLVKTGAVAEDGTFPPLEMDPTKSR